jgi:GR25 family glycosyltransferase involved in LPS biosynthesis
MGLSRKKRVALRLRKRQSRKHTRRMRGGNNVSPLKFAVVAIFKNEALGIREWLEHYKWQGVDKVLLLNNNSTDDWKEQVKGFDDFVTVLDAHKNGAQTEHYEKLGIPWLHANNIDVVTFVDIDEFMFGTGGKNLKQRVQDIFGNPNRPSRVLYLWTVFGSSGHDAQPKSIRKGFIWKSKNSEAFLKNRNTIDGSVKSIAWVKDILPGPIDIHRVKTSGKELSVYDSPPGIQLNHYRIQSKQFWRNVKMPRGNAYHADTDDEKAKSAKRNWAKFDNSDINEVKDETLKDMVEEYEKTNQTGGGIAEDSIAYVINMDKSVDRLNDISEQAKKAGLKLTRFPGVAVDDSVMKVNNGEKLQEEGIGYIIYVDPSGKFANKGKIGCFLSHRNLLKKISEDPSVKSEISIILEDDAIIPENILQKLNDLHKVLPSDWDMCFIGKWQLDTVRVTDTLHKITNRFNPDKNWGTWAYIVKNASIKDKILPCLEVMGNPIDTQYNYYTNKIQTYVTIPNIVEVNMKVESARQSENSK